MNHGAARSAADGAGAPSRVLVVEDDPDMRRLLETALRRQGYVVDSLSVGTDVVRAAARCEYSAIVLDVLLPGANGFEVCASLRQRGRWVPVLMLTALAATDERVRGLRVGADDYLTKPFALEELEARVHALIRRNSAAEAQTLRCGELCLHVAERRCFLREEEVLLTPREHSLLRALLQRPGIVLTRRTIMDMVWGGTEQVNPNAVEQAIGHLRRKIGADMLQTVHGVGYRLVDPPARR